MSTLQGSLKDLRDYVECVVVDDRLEAELVHIQRLLIGATKYPHVDKSKQHDTITRLSALFRALLHAKETFKNQSVHSSGTVHTAHFVRTNARGLKYP